MAMLHKLDKVAYVRFASVYRDFKDVNDFVNELKTLKLNRTAGHMARQWEWFRKYDFAKPLRFYPAQKLQTLFSEYRF